MKKLTWLILTVILVLAIAVPGWSVDLTNKWAISLKGGGWKLGLTKHSDFWTIGPEASFSVKYGINKSLMVGATGYFMQTYVADTSKFADGAKLTFSNYKGGYRQRNYLAEATIEYHFLPENEKFSPYILGGAGIYIWAWKNSGWTTLTSDSFQVAPYNLMGIPHYDKVGKAYDLKDKEITGVAGAGFEWFPMTQLSVSFVAKFHYLSHLLTDFKSDKDIVGTGAGQLDLPKAIAEASIGVTYWVGAKKDSDKDGVPDGVDQCPDTPLGCVVDAVGCPLDSDGDGVCDGLDKCPDTPKGCKVDANGCPIDSDGDGVCDGLDQCANTPKGVKVDSKGCPLDADGDGVPDYLDKCPNTPKGCKVDANGCPIDSDGDGVCDGVDRCPDTPAGVKVDEFGCPLVTPLEEKTILHINFKSGSADIDAPSQMKLDSIVTILNTYKDVKVEVGGYTDAQGSKATNMQLSQKRADKVKEYFASKGIDPGRITTKGYGPASPIGDNKTKDGRAMNRRVEIVVKK